MAKRAAKESPRAKPPYFSYVLVGNGERRIWEESLWPRAVAALDPLIDPDTDIGVRTTQHDAATGREPRLGKLCWNAASHAKWPLRAEGETRRFYAVELWMPRWTICDRERRDPTLFVAISNPRSSASASTGHYNQVVHLAFAEPFPSPQGTHRCPLRGVAGDPAPLSRRARAARRRIPPRSSRCLVIAA